MKKGGLFFAIFISILLGVSSSFAESGWLSFSTGQLTSIQPIGDSRYPQVSSLASNANEVILEVNFAGMTVEEVEKEGMIYQTLFIPGGGRTSNLGWPELPTFGRFIAVPQQASPQVEILNYTVQTLSGYNIYPVQEQPVDLAGAPQPEFTKDEDFYQRNEFYPERMAFVEEPKIIRGCLFSLFTTFPVQYNPATQELRVCSYMRVKINFVGGNGVFIDPAYRSPYFESLYQNLLLNYSFLGSPSQLGGKSDTGCDFLIITHPNFQAWAESLALWKNLSGIPTWVKSTGEIGSDTTSIRLYIQNAYFTWTPKPSFVLLLGDAEFIPVLYRTTHPYYSPSSKTGTDLYYTTVDGLDYFPDIFAGRISVDSASQAGVVISKILQYERSPIGSPSSFYGKALVAGYFQDYNSPAGWEDRFFIKTSEVVRDFLVSKVYSVERCYTKTSGSNPCCYYYGDALPPGLTWNGDATQINNAINSGIFLLNHRDHGSEDGWGDPAYNVSNINALTNGDKLPVVLSINCETGHFDNETDATSLNTPATSVYFCETFQRKANGGAVGIFGHTRVSWSGLNDELCKGFYDAIWTDFDPSYPGGGSTHPIYGPMFRMGAMLNFGKFWMYDKYYLTGGAGYPWGSSSTTTKCTFEMGTWFGDPTMQIWTRYPILMEVTHTDTIMVGASIVSVSVQSQEYPLESAYVCLMNDEVYQTGYTNAQGEVTFSCSTTVEGNLHATITKHDYRPYQGVITILQSPFIRGDANGDEIVDIADVIFLINYLFENGPAPYPINAGDADCNSVVDVADVIYLINYLFVGGPVPDCS